jgi:opacity protein-like surface antigen
MFMKKKLIYSTAVAALFSASAIFAGGPEMVIAAPSPFDGFYVGGTIGLHQTGFDIDGSTDFVLNAFGFNNTLRVASLNGGASDTDAYYGVRGGWGKTFMNRWYGGIEGFAEFGHANGDVTSTTNGFFFTNTFTNSAEVSTTWGVAARLGILLSPTTLAYAKLGAEWADLEACINGNVTSPFFRNFNSNYANGCDSDNKAGFLWGFGAEQFVWSDVVSLFAEFTHTSIGSATTNSPFSILPGFVARDSDSFVGFVFSNSVNTEISQFTGGINFHFRTNWL